MSEHLRYDFRDWGGSDQALKVVIPSEVWQKFLTIKRATRTLGILKRGGNKLIGMNEADDTTTLTVNDRETPGLLDPTNAFHKVVEVLALVDVASREHQDPNIVARLAVERGNDKTRFFPSFTLRWPNATEAQTEELATDAMSRFACNINYEAADAVYAEINRSGRGILLETNPLGTCGVGSGGPFYDPENDRVELYADNIYSPEQQLICLAGAVAIARADELA